MNNIIKIEEHLYEVPRKHGDSKVRIEYRIFTESHHYYITKTKSQLTENQRKFPKTQIFHF